MTERKTIRIFTFGWSEEFVIRSLIRNGISKEDVIVLIGAKPEFDYTKVKVDEAYKQVAEFLRMVGVQDLRYYEVDLNQDIVNICRSIIKIVKMFDSSLPINFYLTGGMRILVIAGLLVARFMSEVGRDVKIEVSREDRLVSYSITSSFLSFSPKNVTNAQVELLKYLKGYKEATFDDLAIGRSDVTVRKHLTALEKKGLVTHVGKGRKHVYRLTLIGEMLLDIQE